MTHMNMYNISLVLCMNVNLLNNDIIDLIGLEQIKQV